MKYAILNLLSFFSIVMVGCLSLFIGKAFGQEATPVTFDDQVKPILQQRCSSCHSASRKESDLDVTNYTSLMAGGGSGEVIAPGSANDSYLYRLVTHSESPEMPPSGKIPDAEINILEDWINKGALENKGSKPRKAKPKMDMAVSGDATARPEKIVMPLRIPIEPVLKTGRPSTAALAVSPWAKVVAMSVPRQVLLYNTENFELEGVLPFEEGTAQDLRFSRNGSLLLGAGGKDGKSGTTVLWNVATGERIATIGEELDSVMAADISPAQDLIALGGTNKLVKVFSVQDGSVLFELKKHNEWVTALEFSPNGKFLASADRNGAIHVWETASGAEVFMLSGHTKGVSAISWRADSKLLASGSEDTTIRTWELDKGTAVKNWGAHGGGVTDLQFLRDGSLVSCGRDNVAKTWKGDGAVIRQFPGMADVAVSTVYCNETNRVIAADWSGAVVVWNSVDGAELGRLSANPPTLAERLQEANTRLANANNNHAPLVAQLEQVTAKMTELTTMISTNEQNRNALEAKLNSMKATVTEAQQKMASLAEQQVAMKGEKENLEKTLPNIKEALEKLTAAAAQMASDAELQQSKAQLEAKRVSIEARMTELAGLLPKMDEEQVALKTKTDEMDGPIKTDSEQLAAMDGALAGLKAQVAPLQAALTEAAKKVELSTQELAVSQQMVAKWTGETEFIKQLQALKQELQQVDQTIEQKQAAEDVVKAKIQELEAQLNAARQQTQESEQKANEIRKRILDLQGS